MARLNDTKAIAGSKKPRNPLFQSTDAKGSSEGPNGYTNDKTYNQNTPSLPPSKGSVK